MKEKIQNIEELNSYVFQCLKVNYSDYTLTIILDRPEVYNALNMQFINELLVVADFLELHEKNQREYYRIKNLKDFELRGIPFIEDFKEIRCIVFTSSGKNFCSGADLNWLKEGLEKTYDENFDDSYKLVLLLEKMYHLTIPIISLVNGFAVGGGVGLLLASDVVFATPKSRFGISEVTIGVIPVAIIKYLKLKFRDSDYRPYLLSGERFDVEVAKQIGIVNFIAEENEIESKVGEFRKKIINNGPIAVQKVKEIVNFVDKLDQKSYLNVSADIIAKLRQGNESINGIQSFLDKRKPKF